MDPARYVLLVEDDALIVQLMFRVLEPMDPAPLVTHAADGEEALDYLYARGRHRGLKVGDPTLILLDLVMPKIDGMEVLRQIKADDRLKSIPVVMLTSTANERIVRQSYSLGANAFVLKPVDFQQFQAVIGQVFSFWMSINVPPAISGSMSPPIPRRQSMPIGP